jgi:uncharacterized protein
MDLEGGGDMDSKEELLERLRGLKEEARRKYRIKAMGVFGSAMRGKIDEAHDIDILVDFEDAADLFDLVGLGLFLEEKLQRKVDVVPRRALRAELRESVLGEVAAL